MKKKTADKSFVPAVGLQVGFQFLVWRAGGLWNKNQGREHPKDKKQSRETGDWAKYDRGSATGLPVLLLPHP